jgi:lysophospholipase L1-like esterase
VQLEPGQELLPPPALGTRRIAFFGDSITQGSRLVRAGRGPGGGDGTLAYPALTASAFRARALQVGFGGQGLLVPGVGRVPPAAVTLDRVFAGVADDGSFAPDVVVVNQGTNDVRASSVAFRAAYLVYLRRVRELYPRAEILALRPLVGRHADAVRAAVSALRDPRARYVDTTGWLGRGELNDSVHPNARGHARVAARLTAVVAAVTGWRPLRPRWSALPTPAPRPGPGGPSPADLS